MRLFWLSLVLLSATACNGNLIHGNNGSSNISDPAVTVVFSNPALPTGHCNSAINSFTTTMWLPIIGVDCLACHLRHGVADQSGSQFILAHPSEAGYLETNLTAVQAMLAINANGATLLLAKATDAVKHGGGQRFSADSIEAATFNKFSSTADFETGCDDNVTPDKIALIKQLSESDTLRRAALQIAGRLPTTDELRMAATGNLDGALSSLFLAPGFGNYVLRSFDNVFLNVGKNYDNQGLDLYSFDNNIAPEYCASPPLSPGKSVDRGCQVYWFANNAPSNVPGIDDRIVTQMALVTPGLQLIKYLATTGRDYRDILNANYMMLNPWSARALSNDFNYNLLTQTNWKNINDPNDFEPVVMSKSNWPTVGLLSDNGFLVTYPTTATNRNRKRAHFIYQYYLGLDVLTLSQRPRDLAQILAASAMDPNLAPPFMSNNLCTDCHSLVDPVAANFAGYNDSIDFTSPAENPNGAYGFYAMFPPGFEGIPEPQSEKSNGPRWLAAQITSDPRFARAQVVWWFTILTSQIPMGDPPPTTKDVNAYLAAQRYQANFFSDVTSDFVSSGYNIQVVIRDIIKSVYYRGVDLPSNLSLSDFTMLDPMIGYRWTGPDALNNKLLATIGTTWLSANCQGSPWGCLNQPLVREYEGLLGGVDPVAAVTQVNESTNGLMMRITTTMASQVACDIVAQDFNKPAAQRVLFSNLDPNVVPDTATHRMAIQSTIASIYEQVTGAHPQDVSENLADAYNIFISTLQNGQSLSDKTLNSPCQNGAIIDDPTYTLKAWIAVMTYILSDPRLMQE